MIPVGDQLDLALIPHLRESGTAGSSGARPLRARKEKTPRPGGRRRASEGVRAAGRDGAGSSVEPRADCRPSRARRCRDWSAPRRRPHLDALQPREGSQGWRGPWALGPALGPGVAAVVAVAVVYEEQQRQHVAQVQVHEHHQHQEVSARADAARLAQRPDRCVLTVTQSRRCPDRVVLGRRPLRTHSLRPPACRRRHGAQVARAPRGGAAGLSAPPPLRGGHQQGVPGDPAPALHSRSPLLEPRPTLKFLFPSWVIVRRRCTLPRAEAVPQM